MINIAIICALFLLSGCPGALDESSNENRRTPPENDQSSKPKPPVQPDLNPQKPAWRTFQSSAFHCEKLEEETEDVPPGIEESVRVVNSHKKSLNILFMGESSVGKSTLINIFYNQIKGNAYDARESPVPGIVTEQVQAYRVESNDYIVNLIDTPGLSAVVNDLERAEKSAGKIGDAIARIQINAIAIVVHGDKGIIKSSGTDNILEMMAKKFSKNIVGIFNGSRVRRKSTLEYSRTMFADLFLKNAIGLTPETYLIDGNEFFARDDAEELRNSMPELEKLWQKDSLVVKQILHDAAQKTPVNGKEIWKIQRIKEKMDGLVIELGSLLSKDLYVNYVQQRLKNPLWKPYHKDVPSFITDGNLEYKDTLISEVICEHEVKRLEEEQKKRLCRVVALETQLEPLVMAAIANPYLVYLSNQPSKGRGLDFELSAYQYWQNAYEHLIQN